MLSKQFSKKFSSVKLARNSNQASGIGKYAIDFMNNGQPSVNVLERVKQFHTDSVMCGLSALSLKTNAPSVLKNEALEYGLDSSSSSKMGYARCFGANDLVPAEKAILANASAVREWDSNGTVFGFNSKYPGHQAGEFGHNDFYPVVVAAAQQQKNINGMQAALGMICLDEIRGRLAEVFSLKTYKIDHVVHGAIASAATYGAMMGANEEQIESAIGMVCAHYIPFRAIRAGKQLSDSKGASAAISTEAAIMSMKRSMKGFVGPKDIFRNPEAIWRLNQPTNGDSPFDIILSNSGDDFAVMGMHFKLGLYEHQSAGAIQGVINALVKEQFLTLNDPDSISKIKITAYEPAFGIIGDPAKRQCETRQSADHSMVYIISTLLRKALQSEAFTTQFDANRTAQDVWKMLMLDPVDYSHGAVFDSVTKQLMDKIEFEHGGKEYDDKYPDGIPTSIDITTRDGRSLNSGLVMYPGGHARNTTHNLQDILDHKWQMLGNLALSESGLEKMLAKLNNLESLTNKDLQSLYQCNLKYTRKSVDDSEFVLKY